MRWASLKVLPGEEGDREVRGGCGFQPEGRTPGVVKKSFVNENRLISEKHKFNDSLGILRVGTKLNSYDDDMMI